MPRPEANQIFSCQSPQWKDLNGDLLVKKLLLGKNIFDATCVEFPTLLQPNSDMQTLENRRGIFECLLKVQDQLDPLLRELAEQEHVFTHFIQQEKNPSISYAMYLFTFQGGTFILLTGLNLPYVFRHFFNDWQKMMANPGNIIWYYVILSLKVAGLLGGLYSSYQSACFMITKIKNEFTINDCLVLDFAKAMKPLRMIMAIVAEHPPLANNFARIIDFDHELILNKELAKTIKRAEKRLDADGNFFAKLWALKDSPAVYEELKGFSNYFKLIYWSFVRLDAYSIGPRIYCELNKKGQAVCLAQFTHTPQRPYFSFKKLRNPLIDDSVANDFELDGHAVFNGAPTGGKTAAIKTIGWGYIMGQSGFVVFAEEACIAPVSAIGTYFNVGDDIEQDKSGLIKQYTEMKNLERLAEHEPGRTLLLIDEPLKGVHDIGESIIADLMKQLLRLPRLTFLMSTHYKSPTLFTEEEKNSVHNWYPEVIENEGAFIPTFKFSEGISWWLTDYAKAQRLIDQIRANLDRL